MLFGICWIDVNITDVFLQYRIIILGIPYRFIAINIQLVPILFIGKTRLSFYPFFKIQIQVFFQQLYPAIWVCLKIGYIPNYSHLIGIMISKTIGFRGLAYFQTHPYRDEHQLTRFVDSEILASRIIKKMLSPL